MGSLSTQSSLNDTERPAAPHRTSRVSRYVTPVSLIPMLPLTLSFECLYPRVLHFGLMHDRWIEQGKIVKVCGMLVLVISSSSSSYFLSRILFKENVGFSILDLHFISKLSFATHFYICFESFSRRSSLFLFFARSSLSLSLLRYKRTKSHSCIIFSIKCSFVNLS